MRGDRDGARRGAVTRPRSVDAVDKAIIEALQKNGREAFRRIDFALFMVEALKNDELIHQAPAIVGCQTPSALAHAASE